MERLALFRGSIPYSGFFLHHFISGRACGIYINCVLLCFNDVDIIFKELINKTKSHYVFILYIDTLVLSCAVYIYFIRDLVKFCIEKEVVLISKTYHFS